MRTGIGYASEGGERDLLARFGTAEVLAEIDPIVAPGDVVQLQRVIAQLPAAEPVRAYLVRLLRATREHPDVLVGASPRAMLSMFRCAQAAALLTTPPRSPSSTCAACSSRASRTASACAPTPRRAPSARRSSSARPCPSRRPRRRSPRPTGAPRPGAPVQIAA